MKEYNPSSTLLSFDLTSFRAKTDNLIESRQSFEREVHGSGMELAMHRIFQKRGRRRADLGNPYGIQSSEGGQEKRASDHPISEISNSELDELLSPPYLCIPATLHQDYQHRQLQKEFE
ncbi:hypothetical protein GBA52_015292 [Prunus armeniaca]|nr:hypothetical protein GBA52_015292 [Prunus armeniaca]